MKDWVLYYKEDWGEIRERYISFWGGRLNEPLIAVTAPREKPIREIKPLPVPPQIKRLNVAPDYEKAWLLDPDFAVNRTEIKFSKTYYGGDAFPFYKSSFGVDMMASFFGIEPAFHENTTWFGPPIIKDWHNIPKLKFNPENKWWQLLVKSTKKITEKAKGKFIVAILDLNAGLDTLASLRGNQNLLVDLVDYPEEVKECLSQLYTVWERCYEELYQITQKGQVGSASWLGLWSPGKGAYPVQCDFAHMVSPEMFEEFVLPTLRKQCQFLDHSIYHLDGKGQIPHLDLLLRIKELNGIQWSVPVVPPDPPHDSEVWYPYFRRIQEARKVLCIWARPENVKRLTSDLSPKGLFIETSCKSKIEVRRLLKEIGRV